MNNIILDWDFQKSVIDDRLFCVVMNPNPYRMVRQILRVCEESIYNMDQVKQEYYAIYQELEGDIFFLSRGLSNATKTAKEMIYNHDNKISGSKQDTRREEVFK